MVKSSRMLIDQLGYIFIKLLFDFNSLVQTLQAITRIHATDLDRSYMLPERQTDLCLHTKSTNSTEIIQ